jgi:hypothetical protein
MNKFFLFLIFFFGYLTGNTQNFVGQWKGEFVDKSSAVGNSAGDKCDYVLELDVKGEKVNGSSYTYFTEGGKQFYTICKIEGNIDFKKKYIEIRETQRTKTNIPINIRNCYQVHKLTYFKQGDIETLEGNWVPAPNQEGSCGFGNTKLTRRSLANIYPNAYANLNKQESPAKAQAIQTKPATVAPKEKLNTADIKLKLGPKKDLNNTVAKPDKDNSSTENKIIEKAEKIAENKPNDSDIKLEKRKTTVLKTIEVESKTVKIDLYDNGEVDGDSISLIYNGKILISNKGLTTKAITLNLDVNDENPVNELVMYAENLGTIAPNTALMVVTDGPNRYEVRITSDLEKSGVIRFVHKAPK